MSPDTRPHGGTGARSTAWTAAGDPGGPPPAGLSRGARASTPPHRPGDLRYFGRLTGSRGPGRDRAGLDAFDLHAFGDGRYEALSTGQKQRVSIARAVLDRQCSMSPPPGSTSASSDMIQFIESRQGGTCVLFGTHILNEAERLCDRIGIYDGRMPPAASMSCAP